MAQVELICTELACVNNDGDKCSLEQVTLGSEGQCEDFEEE